MLNPDVFSVLIESDWNLKLKIASISSRVITVLIESDWNLKDVPEMQFP